MKSIYAASFIIVALAAVGCGGSDNNGGAGGTTPGSSSVIGLWTTTSTPTRGGSYEQVDRLARPVVNEVFATVANNRHEVNDKVSPPQDRFELKKDLESFLAGTAGRSPATRNVIESVLVPDMMVADLSSSDKASYLGYETAGATGGKFGGRGLSDDVVDISLGIVFGNTISALGLAPDDGKEVPTLTSDHVGPDGKHFSPSFPYLGTPR